MKFIIFAIFLISKIGCQAPLHLDRSLLDQWFPDLTTISILDLSSRQIDSIDQNTFSGLTNLQQLRLQRNKLMSLDAQTFKDLTSLQILDLGTNQINSIDPLLFSGLTSLQEIWLNPQPDKLVECADVLWANQLKNVDTLGEPDWHAAAWFVYRFGQIGATLDRLEWFKCYRCEYFFEPGESKGPRLIGK